MHDVWKILIALAVTVVGVTAVMWYFNSRKRDDQPRPTADADQLLRQRVVTIRGPLDDEQATKVIAKLLFLQHESPREPVTLLIDSPGGSVIAGMAVIDTIRDLSPPVRPAAKAAPTGRQPPSWPVASGVNGWWYEVVLCRWSR